MKATKVLLSTFAVFALSSCGPAPRIPYQPNLRSMSATNDGLFKHMVGGIGGVAFADDVVVRDSNGRELVKIEAMIKSNTSQSGTERWTVKHANGRTASYIVKWNGPDFEVKPEKPIKSKN